MMFDRWLDLQLFAEGGDGSGGDGATAATTGAETPADAGQDLNSRLRELGVPESKLRNRAKKTVGATKTAPQTQQAASAAQTTEEPEIEEPEAEPTDTETKPERRPWDEVKEDYKPELEKMMQERVKKSKQAEETAAKLAPIAELIAQKYGLDPANMDVDSLTQAMLSDDSNFEQQAIAQGTSVEEAKQTAMQTIEQRRVNQHLESLARQGEEMKKVFPNFDLREELKNPTFARMTSPGVGLSVEDAYHAIHRKEIEAAAVEVATKKAQQMVSNSIRAGQRRPDENGTTQQASSVSTFDYSKMSKQEREALKKRIYSGEKIYVGGRR